MIPRPDVIVGKTYRVETGVGALHVVINDHEGAPFEVFLYLGKSGSHNSATTEAIGRLISTSLRAGVAPEVLAKQLFGIRSPRTTMHRGKDIWSLPHGVAVALMQHLDINEEDLDDIEEDPTQ